MFEEKLKITEDNKKKEESDLSSSSESEESEESEENEEKIKQKEALNKTLQ